MPQIKRTKNYLQLSILLVKKMKSKPCDLSKLPRLLSPFFKTSKTGLSITLHSRSSYKGVRLIEFDKLGSTFYFRVFSRNIPNNCTFLITAQTNKELLTKLILKYEFFN
jgi:hypothetical protein